ncbi:MAG: UvrD-helicase domain-containing protein, partial [Firmicutes bacterium]|nr:UvrD-helicase domain-containing protein [Bacillota bacterium]
MEWTKEQLDAVSARGQNLLVSAAAGSGKTAVLTERVATLAEEGTDLSRMLIITFTNAAAAEMKQRISERVPLSVLTKYSISTFNKFAIDIYKSYYHVIGLPPGLAVCDEYKQEILKSEAMDEMFEDHFEADDEDFKRFLTFYCSPKNNDAARAMISSLYSFTQSMPDPEGWLKKLSEEPIDPAELFKFASECAAEETKAASELFAEAGKLLKSAGGQGVPKLAEKNLADLSEVQRITQLLESGRAEAGAEALAGIKYQKMMASKDEKEAYETVKEDVSGLRNKAKDILKGCAEKIGGLSIRSLEEERALILPQIRELCSLTEELSRRYSEKKLSAGLMDFSDTEHFALRILEDPQVCAEYREKFEYIFVDEYQDSNYVQEELVRRISRGDNVFLVGDVKQSIYKFRQAEPELFLEKYRCFRTGKDPLSRVIDLNKNFRSKPLIIALINKVFRRVMTPATVGLEYDAAAALYEGSPYTGPLSYRPKLYLVQKKAEEGDAVSEEIAAMKADELEALNAARLIKEYHGKTVNAKDGDRPLRYSDMAILLRSVKSRGEVYYQTLMQQGIPVYLERGEGYFDTPEIQVFLDLIKICENPWQDVELLAVMHFPSFGFSASELAKIRIEGKGGGRSYYGALKAFAQSGEGPLKDKAAAFLERLGAFRRKAEALPLADFVWELMHESGIASFAQALPGGQQRIANLRAMADRAGAYESETAGGIAGFVSYIEQIAGSGAVDTGQVKMLTEADDVVRIMTIHKSKGLEFPFVLLAGLGSRLGGQADRLPVRRHRELGASLKLADPRRGLKAVP